MGHFYLGAKWKMYSLRTLEGQLLRCRFEISTEKDEQGRFVHRGSDGDIEMWSQEPTRTLFEHVDRVADAHGVSFLCPKSFEKNGGNKGTHSVYIFFKGSPHAGRNTAGEEVLWTVVGGSSIDDLQLSPSILEQDAGMPPQHQCNWHGFIGTSGAQPGHAISV